MSLSEIRFEIFYINIEYKSNRLKKYNRKLKKIQLKLLVRIFNKYLSSTQ